MCPGNRTDALDFLLHMHALMPWPPEPPIAGPPPTCHEMERAVQKGSPATCLDQLPRPLVSALRGFRSSVLVGVLEALASGISIRLLLAVLHLCLAKKLPAWLVRNSRLVIMEPYLWRLETGVVHYRRVTSWEFRGAVPLSSSPTGGSLTA